MKREERKVEIIRNKKKKEGSKKTTIERMRERLQNINHLKVGSTAQK